VATHLKSESESSQPSLEMVGVIDEKRCLFDRLFLAEIAKKQPCSFRGPRRKQPNVQEFVRFGIDGSVQPVPFVIELNHSFVDRDVIRTRITTWL
jgi:hypothetical protein